MTVVRRAGALAGLLFAAAGDMARAGATAPPPDGSCPVGPHLSIAAGVVEVFDPEPRGFYSIAWQYRRGGRRVSPWLFAEATTRDTFIGFGGLVDFPVGGRAVVTPSFAVAVYHEHDGIGLGSMIEFRSGLEATWPVGPGRLGAAFLHYSHAGVGGDGNPGTEALLVVWTTPIGRR